MALFNSDPTQDQHQLPKDEGSPDPKETAGAGAEAGSSFEGGLSSLRLNVAKPAGARARRASMDAFVSCGPLPQRQGSARRATAEAAAERRAAAADEVAALREDLRQRSGLDRHRARQEARRKRVCDLDEATFRTVRASLSEKERRLFDDFRGPKGREKETAFRESLRGDGEPKRAPGEGLVESFSMIEEALQQATMISLAEVREQEQEKEKEEEGDSGGTR